MEDNKPGAPAAPSQQQHSVKQSKPPERSGADPVIIDIENAHLYNPAADAASGIAAQTMVTASTPFNRMFDMSLRLVSSLPQILKTSKLNLVGKYNSALKNREIDDPKKRGTLSDEEFAGTNDGGEEGEYAKQARELLQKYPLLNTSQSEYDEMIGVLKASLYASKDVRFGEHEMLMALQRRQRQQGHEFVQRFTGFQECKSVITVDVTADAVIRKAQIDKVMKPWIQDVRLDGYKVAVDNNDLQHGLSLELWSQNEDYLMGTIHGITDQWSFLYAGLQEDFQRGQAVSPLTGEIIPLEFLHTFTSDTLPGFHTSQTYKLMFFRFMNDLLLKKDTQGISPFDIAILDAYPNPLVLGINNNKEKQESKEEKKVFDYLFKADGNGSHVTGVYGPFSVVSKDSQVKGTENVIRLVYNPAVSDILYKLFYHYILQEGYKEDIAESSEYQWELAQFALKRQSEGNHNCCSNNNNNNDSSSSSSKSNEVELNFGTQEYLENVQQNFLNLTKDTLRFSYETMNNNNNNSNSSDNNSADSDNNDPFLTIQQLYTRLSKKPYVANLETEELRLQGDEWMRLKKTPELEILLYSGMWQDVLIRYFWSNDDLSDYPRKVLVAFAKYVMQSIKAVPLSGYLNAKTEADYWLIPTDFQKLLISALDKVILRPIRLSHNPKNEMIKIKETTVDNRDETNPIIELQLTVYYLKPTTIN